MADAVTSQTIENGPRNLVMKFTNVSDGTGESDVVKVDVSALGVSTTSMKVRKIWYNVTGGAVNIEWDATADQSAFYLSGHGWIDIEDTQGAFNPAGAGNTGDILFSTSGFVASGAGVPASGYTIILFMVKGNAP